MENQLAEAIPLGSFRKSGVPDDNVSFLVKPEYLAFRSLEMHSKRRYKICTCSVIREELVSESFRNYKAGFSIIFPKTLDAISPITKDRTFLIPLSITFLNRKNFRFPFFMKNSNLGSEM